MLQTKGKTKYMGGTGAVKLKRRETETAKPIMTITELVPSIKPILLTDSS
jgi:hypothetical protein